MGGLSKPNPTPGSFKAFIPNNLVAKPMVTPTVESEQKKKANLLTWLWPFGKKDKS
jgi:hypothetical protein